MESQKIVNQTEGRQRRWDKQKIKTTDYNLTGCINIQVTSKWSKHPN